MLPFRGKDIYNLKYYIILWYLKYFKCKLWNEKLEQTGFGKEEKSKENNKRETKGGERGRGKEDFENFLPSFYLRTGMFDILQPQESWAESLLCF